jgi:hypothetical protein
MMVMMLVMSLQSNVSRALHQVTSSGSDCTEFVRRQDGIFTPWVCPKAVPALGWMNTAPLSDCEFFSSDNCVSAYVMVYLTLNRLADKERPCGLSTEGFTVAPRGPVTALQ